MLAFAEEGAAPKRTHDAQLAGKIYQAIELELKATARSSAFDKFCAKVELPNWSPKAWTR